MRRLLEKNKKVKLFVLKIYNMTYGKYKRKKLNKKFLEKGEIVLERVDRAFKELEIEYWLDFGTLLGAVREKDFISHDLDLDFGVFIDGYSKEKIKRLEEYGFKKKKEYLIDDGKYGREETYEYLGISLDLFYYTRINEKEAYYHDFIPLEGLSRWKTIEEKGGLIPREITLPLEEIGFIDFKGRKYPIPLPLDGHLKGRYGETYMIPDKNWVQGKRKSENIKIMENKIGIRTLYK